MDAKELYWIHGVQFQDVTKYCAVAVTLCAVVLASWCLHNWDYKS